MGLLKVNNSGSWVDIKNALVNQSGSWTQIKNIYVNKSGTWTLVWQNEVAITLSSQSTSINMRTLFDSSVWTSTTPKRIIIPAGVNINSNNFIGAIYLDSGTAWGGNLTVDISGSLYGTGGVYLSNSGEGGAGIGSAIAGASGQRITVNLLSGGVIKAGGGAGGQGGQGGSGTYTYISSDSGFIYDGGNYWYDGTVTSRSVLKFGGGTVYAGDNWSGILGSPYISGSSTYERGTSAGQDGYGTYYTIRRTITSTGTSTGGAGGYGGRGQGADGAAANGSTGAAGGTNAGTGGTGGTGGAWGSQGGTGSTGSAGNAGSGASGSTGGLGGKYAYGYLSFNNSGTVLGRLVLS